MTPYTSRGRSAAGQEGQELARSCTYDLLCVVVHVGEIDTGHYVSYCRVGDQVSTSTHCAVQAPSNADKVKWFAFNDHRVELATKSEVLNAKAYLLFYIIRSLS